MLSAAVVGARCGGCRCQVCECSAQVPGLLFFGSIEMLDPALKSIGSFYMPQRLQGKDRLVNAEVAVYSRGDCVIVEEAM